MDMNIDELYAQYLSEKYIYDELEKERNLFVKNTPFEKIGTEDFEIHYLTYREALSIQEQKYKVIIDQIDEILDDRIYELPDGTFLYVQKDSEYDSELITLKRYI